MHPDRGGNIADGFVNRISIYHTMYRAENYLCPIVLLLHKRALVGVRADLDGSRHGGIGLIGCRRGSWLCLAESVQPLTLDNGREILIADIQIHITVKAYFLSAYSHTEKGAIAELHTNQPSA